jgi:hypothetical protein
MSQSQSQYLPEEILDRIVSGVENRSDLIPLMTASRTLKRITTPHLYRVIFLYRHDDEDDEDLDAGLAYLRPLTYHLLKHPEIACLAHSFDLRSSYNIVQVVFPPGDSDKHSWPAQDDLDDILRSTIAGLQYKGREAEDIFDTTRTGGNESAILALLLQSLPNLESLLADVHLVPLRDTDYVMEAFQRCAMLSTANGNFVPFQSLEAVMMSGEDETYPSDPDLFGLCLALPAMRRAFGRNLGSDWEDETETAPIQTLPVQSLNLELLHIEYSKLNRIELFALLRAPKKLKTFIYEPGNVWVGVPVSIPDIAEALQPHHAWLEELCLTHDDWNPFDYEDSDPTPISLREYTSLKVLKIAPVFMFGHGVLYSNFTGDVEQFYRDFCSRFPASLEKLHFTYAEHIFCGTETYAVSALETLLRQKGLFLPNLKNLTLEGSSMRCADDVNRFIEFANDMGINTGMDNGWDHGQWATVMQSDHFW